MTDNINNLIRHDSESFDDFALRLYANKDTYGLTCWGVANLLNKDSGWNKDESAFRKYYSAFLKGIEYQKKKSEHGVITRILCLSDFHFPFQLPITTFEEYANKVDVLVLNGDLLDFYNCSKFPKSFRVSPIEEMIGGRQYIIDLINLIHPKKVIAIDGNHEYRLATYLNKNLDCEINELMPDSALEYLFVDGFNHYDKRNGTKTWYSPIKDVCTDVEIIYARNWFYQLGDTIFTHPKAFSSAMMKTAEKAMQWFRNEGYVFNKLVMAHTHRLGLYKIGNTTLYEQGCCCNTKKMNYSGGLLTNSQKEGFLYLCLNTDGKINEDATKLVSLN